MRDWLLILVPMALVFYFVLDPSQFWVFVDWLTRLTQ
jgi:hypothetical protein